MITRWILAMALLIGLASLCAAQSSSANYTLNNSVIASAGNTSISANYSLGSTLGQPSAIGESSSASNRLEAGFWYQRVPPVGDVTGDCTVNVLDMIHIRNHMYEDVSSGDNWRYDLTGDGSINVLDMLVVRNHVRETCTD